MDAIDPDYLVRTLSYGNYGTFLTMGDAGVIPSTVPGSWASSTGFHHTDN